MTTLRDILNDFATQLSDEVIAETVDEYRKQELVDEYVEQIKERLIG